MRRMIRRCTSAIVLALLGCAAAGVGQTPSPGGETLVYVGGSGARSKGIYLFRLQSQDLTLVPLGLAVETLNPSFLEFDFKRRLLFAVNSTSTFEGKASGAVSAFSIDPSTGKLTLLNQRASMGTGPTHLVLDKSGRSLLVANYGSGSVAVLPVASDGRLGEATSFIQHTGSSVNPQRQEGPHAHCVTLDPANRFAFVCDLGLDKVLIYRLDAAAGKLTPNEPAFASVKPGSGPRHMVFRPDGRFAYVVNELTSTVTAFAYDARRGALREIETVSSLPPNFDGANTGAEIDVHPSGKYLYVSNRGHNSVALFGIDRVKGTLTFVDAQGTGGRTQRHFGIEPSAKHLVIANQGSDSLLVCRIEPADGRLKPSGVFAEAPSPTCARFLPPLEKRK